MSVHLQCHPENDKHLTYEVKDLDELREAILEIWLEAERAFYKHDKVTIQFQEVGHIDVIRRLQTS